MFETTGSKEIETTGSKVKKDVFEIGNSKKIRCFEIGRNRF
jgi:hypothetical protein